MEQTVTIFCKNNQQFKDYPRGTSLMDIYKDMNIQLKYPVVAARVNYKVEDLNFLIYKPKDIDFIDASTPSGIRVYLRSISMVMAKALYDLHPGATLRIEHPIARGYYCCIDGRNKKVRPETITALKKRMQEIIAENLPIVSEEKQTNAVIEMFRNRDEIGRASCRERV